LPGNRDLRITNSEKATHTQKRESHLAGNRLNEDLVDMANFLVLQIFDFRPFISEPASRPAKAEFNLVASGFFLSITRTIA
jgi:hypothetical protein